MIAVRVVAPHFVAGFEIDPVTQRVVRTAPILKYLKGQTAQWARAYIDRKGWEAKRVEADQGLQP